MECFIVQQNNVEILAKKKIYKRTKLFNILSSNSSMIGYLQIFCNKYKLQDTMISYNSCIDYRKRSMVLRLHFLIKDENAKPLSTNAADVGQQVSDRLNRVNLFLQKFRLQVVTEVGIIVDGANLMQRQQALKKRVVV